MVKWSEDEIVDNIFKRFDGAKITLLAPLVRGRKGHYRELFEEVRKKGFLKVRVDGEIKDLVPKMQVDRYKIHDIELVVDRLKVTTDHANAHQPECAAGIKAGKGPDVYCQPMKEEVQQASRSKVWSKQPTAGSLMCEDTGI